MVKNYNQKTVRKALLFFIILFSVALNAQENCANGIDDDSDGLIDLNDPDCLCNTTAIPSIIPNASFEDYSSCPNSFSQLNNATPWIQATEATSDFMNCDFTFPGMTALGLTDYPDGNGAAGGYFVKDWNEYLGTPLLSPMVAGTNYQLTFHIAALKVGSDFATAISGFESVKVTLYGCTNGTNLPLNTVYSPSVVDPTWVVIGDVTYTPVSSWQEITINFTPTITVNAIMLGSPPVLPASYPSLADMNGVGYPYMVYDNLVLNDAAAFGVIITRTGNFCDNNLILTANITDEEISNPTYQWYKDGIAIAGATSATYNVPAGLINVGTYNVRVSDGTDCFISSDTSINNILPGPDVTSVQPTCDISTGSITVTTVASEYSIDSGLTWQTSPNFNTLPVGLYNVKTKSVNGCISSATGVNIVFPPSFVWPFYESTSATCAEGGTITIMSVATEYSFDNGVTWTTNPVATDLPEGIYILRTKDEFGCVSNTVEAYIFEVFNEAPFYTFNQPVCGSGGSISILTEAAQYSFDNGVTWTTNPNANDLPPGEYLIRTKDEDGCMSYAQYVYLYEDYISPPEFTSIQPNCGEGGSITITTPAAQYSFDGGSTWTTNPVATDLSSGYYIMIIKNDLGCISYSSYVYLYEDLLPSPTYTSIDGGCLTGGSITITTVAAEYSFDDGFTWTTNPTATNLTEGYYNIKTRNAAGCESYSQSVYINSFYIPAPEYALILPSCPSESGTGINITITTPAAEYSFDDGLTWSTNPTANNLAPNNYYYIKIKDADGCISYTQYVYVDSQNSIPNAPAVSIAQPVNCTTSTGFITITTNAVQYSFDNGLTWGTNPVSPSLASGTYYVKIKTSNNGCPSYPTTAIINAPQDAPPPPVLSIIQPTTCANPFGSITVTSAAYQYSFDNGVTYTSNTTSGSLPVGNYLVKVKNNAGCESDAVAVTIIPPTDYPAAPTVSSIQPDCSNTKGTITIESIGSEYSLDNGTTWSTNAIQNNLDPGTYLIKIKNASGCISQATTVIIVPFTNFPASPIANSPQSFCVQENASLADIIITGQNIKWYDAITAGNILPASTILNNGIYYASQTIGGCESLRTPVAVAIQNTNMPTGNTTQLFCLSQAATLNNIQATGNNIQFYDSPSLGNLLPLSTILADGITYYASQTINGCESPLRLPITISLLSNLPANDFEDLVCDDLNDDSEIVDLANYDSQIIANSSNYTFTYYTTAIGAENELAADKINNSSSYNLDDQEMIVYVRVENNNDCHTVVELKLTLIPSPFINMKDTYDLCENGSITINADPNFDSYLWSTGATTESIVVNQAGTYSVTVYENHGTVICSSTKDISVVLSNRATITSIETSDWTTSENTITVFVTGLGDYEYSIDGINYQSSSQFFGLENGEYTVYVRDINGCGVSKDDVYLLMYPKFFTPNGDSYNDTWGIKFSENEPNLKVYIFDRYGKFIKQLTDTDSVWNGMYNGELLPSTDYWFTVIRENGKEHKGHFSMKR